ncbi:MAG TPA: hypothetical protein IAB56_05790 [Candidatus Scybalousia intestinigallinarum]|nr:hypothetical protein [Candidatus Scybalousia intestinigallinarum]
MKKKILILSLFLLFTTGCNVTYQVEIYNDNFTEEAVLNAKNNEYIDEFQTTAKDSLEGALTEYKQSAGDGDVKVKDQSNQEDIELFVENNGKITEYGNSVLLKNCFDLVNVLVEEDQYVLATSKGATCFDQFLNMDKLTIHIKTNHKVISHNADKKQLHTYIWEIDKNNASDKSIQMILAKDDYVFNYDNRLVKTIIFTVAVIGGIGGIIGICYFVIKRKNKRANKI